MVAEVVEDRRSYLGDRQGRETGAQGGVELLDGVQQTQHAYLKEVFLRLAGGPVPPADVSDEGTIPDYKFGAGLLFSAIRITLK